MEKKESKRKENWGKNDIRQLVFSYSEKINTLEGKFSTTVSASAKADAWNDVVDSVNSVSSTKRTVEEAKKKYADLKSITKKKERRRRLYSTSTGGGRPADALEDWEEKIVASLSESVIVGVEGGVDTFHVGPSGDVDSTVAATKSTEECKPSTSAEPKPRAETAEEEPVKEQFNTSGDRRRKRKAVSHDVVTDFTYPKQTNTDDNTVLAQTNCLEDVLVSQCQDDDRRNVIQSQEQIYYREQNKNSKCIENANVSGTLQVFSSRNDSVYTHEHGGVNVDPEPFYSFEEHIGACQINKLTQSNVNYNNGESCDNLKKLKGNQQTSGRFENQIQGCSTKVLQNSSKHLITDEKYARKVLGKSDECVNEVIKNSDLIDSFESSSLLPVSNKSLECHSTKNTEKDRSSGVISSPKHEIDALKTDNDLAYKADCFRRAETDRDMNEDKYSISDNNTKAHTTKQSDSKKLFKSKKNCNSNVRKCKKHIDLVIKKNEKRTKQAVKTCTKPRNSTQRPNLRSYKPADSKDLRQIKTNIVNQKSKNKKVKIYCKDCEHTFKYQKNYDRHLEEDKCRHVCEFCGKVFLFGLTGSYKIHINYHLKLKNYECSVCGKKYIEYRKLKEHYRKHTGEKPYMCDECGQTFSGFSRLYSHKKNKHVGLRQLYSCHKCPKVFKGYSGLKFHLKYYHEAQSDKPYRCSKCEKTFQTPDILKRHETVHRETKDFKCDQCNAAFKRIQGLTEHKKRHTKDYTNFCSHCGKGFYTKQSMIAHERVHTGEKPYSCTICHYTCALNGNLKKHMRVHEKSS